ncbi:MAG: hypothetical protein AAFQ84_03315 [Pseudomonadota bacterium]
MARSASGHLGLPPTLAQIQPGPIIAGLYRNCVRPPAFAAPWTTWRATQRNWPAMSAASSDVERIPMIWIAPGGPLTRSVQ